MALGFNLPPIQYELEIYCLGLKKHECEGDHTTPSSSKVKTDPAIPPLLICTCGVIIKYNTKANNKSTLLKNL